MVFMRLPCQHRQAVLVFFTKCGMPKIMPPTPRMQTNQIGQGWNRKRPKALYLLGFRPSMDCSEIVLGGDRRDRTADLLIANQTLSQLSYAPCSLLVTFVRCLYSPSSFSPGQVQQPEAALYGVLATAVKGERRASFCRIPHHSLRLDRC